MSSSKTASQLPHVLKSASGKHVLLFPPWNWLPYDIRAGKAESPTDPETIAATLANGTWVFRRPIQAEIDRHLLGEDLVSPFR